MIYSALIPTGLWKTNPLMGHNSNSVIPKNSISSKYILILPDLRMKIDVRNPLFHFGSNEKSLKLWLATG